MHLLAAQSGGISDGMEAVDLGQTPSDIVVLSAADSDLASLAAARDLLCENGEVLPSLRLANFMNLSHNLSVDLYVGSVIEEARLVIVRLLGGRGYWPYGVEELVGAARRKGLALAFLPGDDQPDAELVALSTLAPEATHRLWQYCAQGGMENAANFLRFAASLMGHENSWQEPAPLLRAGLYWPGRDQPTLDDLRDAWLPEQPVAALLFYRALVQAADTRPVDALVTALAGRGLNPLPIYAASLKDPVAAATVDGLLRAAPPHVVVNATGFALSVPGEKRVDAPFDFADCPVLQVAFSGGTREAWQEECTGINARDLAMSVVLPEVDGRLFTRAVSFKERIRRDEATQCDLVAHEPVADRVAFCADLARAWVELRQTPARERRITLVLANYPNRDGRLGNGVGLDTPAGTVNVLRALKDAGYTTDSLPEDGAALIAWISAGPTNDFHDLPNRYISETISLAEYSSFFATLPESLRRQVTERWGGAEQDPFFLRHDQAFALPVLRCGKVAVALQPARGYNIDPTASYHSPDLVPPHGYFAFYAWLRGPFAAHAVVHMGKHGNLEWLPGKALALSETCFPEAALGPLPHLYPFIVNDPGEGSQAKRRTAAVIIDHLTPPLTRAESYGVLAELEQLVDEYYEAAGLDPRRLALLRREILERLSMTGLDADCAITDEDGEEEALKKLDAYLCELKEMQIRDGLHIFGQSPENVQLTDLLVALLRTPRNDGANRNASLIRALADDLELSFDPLDCDMAAAWNGARPDVLDESGVWRSNGDTVERLESLACRLVGGEAKPEKTWSRTTAVLDYTEETLRPAVMACGEAEIAGLLAGLDGRFVVPGPSGAPTRGRPDVLPTGRNFYSVDTRVVPTPAAWALGWKSATLLLDRYAQEHGNWPRRLALSAWGTSNMRTGGDDIAQALALMGVQPRWEPASRRVTGFEILPVSVLGRPRVDVTLRISGFFRDAFPGLIDLFDSAARAVAELDETPQDNPLAAHVRDEAGAMMARGEDNDAARARAAARVFGSKPGAYGAGLQALIDERGWGTDTDLARAYIAWGGYAYGGGAKGAAEHALFENRLAGIEAVLQNQDNREHDLLDSDDYYQFEGGLAAAVRHVSGKTPAVFHNDHSRPEHPKIRTLEEEIGRVVRARVVNPKWIAGVMRHGYKGAFEMAATVDYLFAFAATAHAVKDHHFDAVFDAYIQDDHVRGFMEEANPAALREMSAKLMEALERGLWRPRSNAAHHRLAGLTGIVGEQQMNGEAVTP
ncbi:MAG: cobaltochelatase subunit CobN [Alphaproteobacteria bacterium]|nr:cobaltochelatase subunit CobN [Alphaproteobacteria bacterium]